MQRREGFTLVEMLVAMAITLFIMVIITTAFTTGLDTFRGLKGIGDMQQALRTATHRLRSDLQADHFDAKKRLSDPAIAAAAQPIEGFFRIEQHDLLDQPTNIHGKNEGNDLDSIESFRAVMNVLHFSVNLRGNRPGDFFTANVPALSPFDSDPANPNQKVTNFFGQPADARFQQKQSYSSQWAEVAYYMERTGSTTDPTDPMSPQGTELYSLYRVQRLLVPDNSNVNNLLKNDPVLVAKYAELSFEEDKVNNLLHFNTPRDVASTDRNKRKRGFNSAPAIRKLGASLILTNVINFRIQVLAPARTAFTDISSRVPAIYDTTRFDAQGSQNPVSRGPLAAIQITLRVWDEATLQARQITIIQDM